MGLTYHRLHIPTGQRSVGEFNATHDVLFDPKFLAGRAERQAAFRLINMWNSRNPGVWQYWMDAA